MSGYASTIDQNFHSSRFSSNLSGSPKQPRSGYSEASKDLLKAWYKAFQDYVTPFTRIDTLVHRIFLISYEMWKLETQFISDPNKIEENRWYREIIRLGPDVVPFILSQMQDRPDYWFSALTEITGNDPIPEEHYGDLAAMTADWLKWGYENWQYSSTPQTKSE